MTTPIFQPPPTYAEPFISNPTGGLPHFNPIWLRWFVDLSKGLSNAGAGSVSAVATGTGLTGGTIVTTGTIALAAVADKRILANISGGALAPAANTLTGILDNILGSTRGQIIYRNATAWTTLGTGAAGNFLTTGGAGADPSWTAEVFTGTVTSVALSLPSIITVSGSPVTSTGTLTGTLATQNANKVWAGPTTGADAAPTFRVLVTADMPSGTGTVTSVSVVTANGVSGTVANATTTPAITLSLGAITPTSVSTGALTSSSLTATRVPYASTAGLLADNSQFVWDNTNSNLSLRSVGGSVGAGRLEIEETVTARQAINIIHGTNADVIFVNKSGGNGAVLNASLASGNASGVTISNTDAATSFSNATPAMISGTVSTGFDNIATYGGFFSCTNTRNTASAHGASGNPIGVMIRCATTASGPTGIGIFVQSGSARTLTALLQAAGSQTSNILEFQNSGGTVLSSVDASANIIAGGSLSQTIANANKLQVQGTTAATNSLGISAWSADALGARIELGKSRGAAIGTNTIVQNNDVLGGRYDYGANGSTFTPAGSITCEVDGTPGATTDMPGRYVFKTTPDGSGTPTTALTLDSKQAVSCATTVNTKGYTVATLPIGVQGARAFCTDLLLPAFLAVAVGGGAVVGPVFFDGTNWVSD